MDRGSTSGDLTDAGAPDAPPDWIETTLAAMTPKQRIGQLLFARYQPSCASVADAQLGGVVYYGSDVTTEGAMRQANLALQTCARDSGVVVPLFSSTNHEGGAIYYFKAGAMMTRFPSARVQCSKGIDYVYQVSLAQAKELKYAGINLTLGPAADVLLVQSNVIGDRAYATTPSAAAACVKRAVEGYHDGQVLATLKHFPGHGGTASDTHLGLAVDATSASGLQTTHLPPFWSGLTTSPPAELAMVSHVLFTSVDPSWPATLSPTVLSLLRGGGAPSHDAVTVTDDMNMGAIANYWGVSTAAALALMAGNDMLMIGDFSDLLKTRDLLLGAWTQGLELSVSDASGKSQQVMHSTQAVRARIDEAVRRILRSKRARGIQGFGIIQELQDTPAPDWSAHHTLAAS